MNLEDVKFTGTINPRVCCHKDVLHTKTEASASAFLCCKGRPGKGYRDVERSAATEQILPQAGRDVGAPATKSGKYEVRPAVRTQ